MNNYKGKIITTWLPSFMIFLVSILVFLPTITQNPYHFSGDSLVDSINSRRHLDIISIAIGTSIPMLLEIIMDYKDLPFNILLPKFFIACGLLIPNAIFLCSDRTSITLFLNVFQSRGTLIAGGLLLSLFDSGDTFHHKITVVVTTVTCVAFMIVSSWGLDGCPPPLQTLLYLLNALCVIEAISISLWYFKKVIRNWSDVMKSTRRKSTLIHAILVAIYTLSWIFVGNIFGNKGWGQTKSNELIVYISVDILVAIVAVTVPSRLIRKENYMTKHTLESKKQFVRYVSHEMRTPLNTVSVGIQLVDKYLQTLDSDLQNLISMTNSPSLNRNHSFLMAFQSMRDHCLHDLKGMVDDISLSCASSIDILNDLLVYDQVEEGHLLLKQRYVKILDCLQNISKPFQLQATEAGIHFSFLGSKLSTHVMEGNGIEREIEDGRGGDDGDDDVSIGEIIVCVDPFKIAQVIRNLLSNAFKYTSQGGSVSVNARVVTKDDTPVGETNSFVRIEIKDTGSGVSLENQPKLFTSIVSFHTDTVENTQDGSGLGLYISAAIVQKHGGTIGVISSGIPGAGSLFFIDLPIAFFSDAKNLEDIRLLSPSPQHDSKKVIPQSILPPLNSSPSNSSPSHLSEIRSPSQTTTVPPANSSSSLFSMTPHNNSNNPSSSSVTSVSMNHPILHFSCALVVDDSAMTRKMLVKSISNYFERILQGGDGIEAVQIMKSQMALGTVPNIVFLDSIMPNMSGIDACREIRSLGYEGIIIAVTGNVLPSDVEEFLSAGADKLVPKPFKIDDIKATLEEYYERIISFDASSFPGPSPVSTPDPGPTDSSSLV